MERGPWQTTVHRVAKELDPTERQNYHHPNWCLCIPHSTFHHLRTLLSQGSCSGQTLVLQNPGDSPQPLACHPARCQNQGPQKTGTHIAPLRYRFSSCDVEQNTPKWFLWPWPQCFPMAHCNFSCALPDGCWVWTAFCEVQCSEEDGRGAGHQQGGSLTLILTLIPCLGSLHFQGLSLAWRRVSADGRVGGELGGQPRAVVCKPGASSTSQGLAHLFHWLLTLWG